MRDSAACPATSGSSSRHLQRQPCIIIHPCSTQPVGTDGRLIEAEYRSGTRGAALSWLGKRSPISRTVPRKANASCARPRRSRWHDLVVAEGISLFQLSGFPCFCQQTSALYGSVNDGPAATKQ